MQPENFEYLKKQLFYTGFNDDKLSDNLQKQMKKGKEEFQLKFKESFERPDNQKNELETTLNFKKGKENDRYYFNSFDAVLTKAEGEKVSQSFYNAQDKSFTKKEAYNLMDGRAVKKEVNHEGEKFNAYLQIDFEKQGKSGNYYFSSFHEKYGFDTEKALSNVPLKELTEDKKVELIKSLDKGNVQQVTLANNQKLFVATNPKYKNLQFSDASGNPLLVEMDTATKEISVSHFTKKSEVQEEKQTAKETIAATEEPEKSRGIKM